MRIIHLYAAWCRRQASTTNCGHVAVAGIAVVVIVTALIARSGGALLACFLAVFALAFAVAAGVAWFRLAHRRPRPRCQDCGGPAAGVVQFANGTRSDEVPLCRPCFERAEAVARLHAEAIPGPDPEPPAPWAGPQAWDPASARLPAAPDNAAPSDEGTAADLAAVLARAQVRP